MGNLAFFLVMLLLIVGGIVLIVRFALRVGNFLLGTLLTEQFRAAEYILEHHQAPASWNQHTPSPLHRLRQFALHGLRHRAEPEQRLGANNDTAVEKARLLTRLEKLIHYFEKSPFFENEETRKLLLEELDRERAAWLQKPLESIVTR